ncbi:RNA-guided endonuclease InsQ/TnpB family protein [Amorphus sp. 3PC139-8]|uniref:RNA-guided endonuclease InsQ/TnpB family protein n=1 Tax=Amorphus sp. 3PC139-8 TaxID=2735676 RepID=UPI00345D4D42
MEQMRANVYRLYPTPAQAAAMARIAGACRFVHNLALEQRRDWWRPGRRFSFGQQARELTALRRQVDWLRDCPVHALQNALRDVDRAFQAFFAGRAGYPQFRSKGGRDSFRESDPACFTVRRTGRHSGMVRIPKVGWVRFRGWYAIPGELRSLTVSRRAGVWSAAIQWRREVVEPAPSSLPPLGLDMGVAVAVATSDGRLIEGPRAYAAARKRLAVLQRAVARKKKGSANRRKAVAKVARLHARIANIRRDWIHKQTTAIAESQGVVVVEALRVRSMSASARGTVEEPGRNVRAKAGLNRSILDGGWFAFRAALAYKLPARGGHLVAIEPAFTSQTCSACGAVDRASRRARAVFACTACGHTDHADVNAANTILRQGLSSMPVEGRDRAPGEAGTIRRAA